ncbi:Aldo/keto reductase [Roridomyces roridus]|uniref:Aldo/keto reductase n=1 Tax=Roridomyces roridus TaxID=1738132 RepID=A0AAD7BCN7_9AGAR|nr:Aldo/keto reductase [Roridomyces roridus]
MSTPKKMEYVRLGTSGLKISKIILGCMSYGSPNHGWGAWVLPEEEASKHIKAAYDAGINAFDTAETYSNGLSEEVLGRAIKQHNLPRDEIVVLTKIPPNSSMPRNDAEGYANQYGLQPQASLKRLQLDYIDVLQCHRFDPNTPIEETMQALHDVVKAGYVRYIGMSSCYAWQFKITAITHNLTPFISMQNHYSLLCSRRSSIFGVGAIPWSPLARGALTRPLAVQQDAAKKTVRADSDGVEELAKKRGVSMAQISIAWAFELKKVCPLHGISIVLDSIHFKGVSAPIVGTTSLANLEDAIAAVHVKLTEDEIKLLEEPYQPMAIMGHV